MNSEWRFYSTCVFIPLSLVSVIVFGQISDRFGRKLPILAPFVGEILNCVALFFNSVYMESSLGYMLIGSFLGGLGGGLYSILMSTVAYITEISSNERKTLRVSLLYACSNLASFVVLTFSGVLLDHTSFQFVFGLCICIYVIGVLYVIIFLKNVTATSRVSDVSNDEKKEEDDDVTCCEETVENVKEIAMVAMKYRKYNRRKQILLLMVSVVGEILGSGYK